MTRVFATWNNPESSSTKSTVLREEMIYQRNEGIRITPHENVCRYFGCIHSEDDKIATLYFERHGQYLYTIARENIIIQVACGAKHFHSLGLIHVVFVKDGQAVIIDYDSCWPLNESLKEVGTEAKISLFQNDMNSIENLPVRTYLYRKQQNS
jgi:hypothetical protein